ncbi:unnamed protein product [Amoebophrya sp. A25]|nr:unnamed protein product [Amoebophrya sp. A25]|eukprot:GSA25T00021035001.1
MNIVPATTNSASSSSWSNGGGAIIHQQHEEPFLVLAPEQAITASLIPIMERVFAELEAAFDWGQGSAPSVDRLRRLRKGVEMGYVHLVKREFPSRLRDRYSAGCRTGGGGGSVGRGGGALDQLQFLQVRDEIGSLNNVINNSSTSAAGTATSGDVRYARSLCASERILAKRDQIQALKKQLAALKQVG